MIVFKVSDCFSTWSALQENVCNIYIDNELLFSEMLENKTPSHEYVGVSPKYGEPIKEYECNIKIFRMIAEYLEKKMEKEIKKK